MDDTATRTIRPAGPDWRVLRDLMMRAQEGRPGAELAGAVAGALDPRHEWQQRWADLQGPRRLALFSETAALPDGFVAAYIDADAVRRVAVVRHLVTTARGSDSDAAGDLLDEVEFWAAAEWACEVVLEVAEDDAALVRHLGERGYERVGGSRPSFDAVIATPVQVRGSAGMQQFRRVVGAPVRRSAPVFAVAS